MHFNRKIIRNGTEIIINTIMGNSALSAHLCYVLSFTAYPVCFEICFNVATANHAPFLKGDVARMLNKTPKTFLTITLCMFERPLAKRNVKVTLTYSFQIKLADDIIST